MLSFVDGYTFFAVEGVYHERKNGLEPLSCPVLSLSGFSEILSIGWGLFPADERMLLVELIDLFLATKKWKPIYFSAHHGDCGVPNTASSPDSGS